MFASSYFYAPTHPTVEDQVELARRISHSLSDAKNMKSKGQSMYVNRKKRSVKWIHDGNGEYRCTCVLHALINLWISCISWTRHRRADTMHIDVHRLHDMLQIFFHNRSFYKICFNHSNCCITGVEDAEESLTPVHRVSGVCSKLQCVYIYIYFFLCTICVYYIYICSFTPNFTPK